LRHILSRFYTQAWSYHSFTTHTVLFYAFLSLLNTQNKQRITPLPTFDHLPVNVTLMLWLIWGIHTGLTTQASALDSHTTVPDGKVRCCKFYTSGRPPHQVP